MTNKLFRVNVTVVLLAISLVSMVPELSAEPMHTPTKMPKAKAESVGMSTEVLGRIDEIMREQMDAGRIQGGATIVARRGKVVHFSTHGEMNVEKSRAMETDALYIMASSAKPVIGVATLMLVDEGLISLSDPISKFIPEFANQKVVVSVKSPKMDGKKEWNKEKKGNKSKEWDKSKRKVSKGKVDDPLQQLVPSEIPLTIHHLLTHTSGLPRRAILRNKGDSLATYVPKLATAPLAFQPGTRFVYGNVGIHSVLPRIIEIVSETPFNEFMQKRVFDPLEMNNTHFHVPREKVSKLVLTEAYKSKGGGGLVSTVEDFLHFEQMLLNGGELFGHRLLRPETVKMMGTNQVGDLFATSGKGVKAQKGMGFGYAVSVTLDPIAADNGRGIGAFGWGGAAGTLHWTDPENDLVGVLMLQQSGSNVGRKFAKIIGKAIID